ncbi:phosphatidylglycerophosphatase A [Thermodesulfobacteriota bacterium]
MNYREKSVMFLATGCFVGNMPVAPGTFGSLLGLPLCFFLSGIDLPAAILLSVLFMLFAIWIAHAAEKILMEKDPGCIVIDEIAGILVVFLGLPYNIFTVIAGFVIFRMFDILKPFPIRFLEIKLPGGAGIVMDDILAGIYSNLVLRALLLFY